MKAETAYNVIQALPEAEKNRLFVMLGLIEKPKQNTQDKCNTPTVQEYKEWALKHLTDRKVKKYGEAALRAV